MYFFDFVSQSYSICVRIKATAILFAKAGSNVVLIARRKEALEAVKEECVAAHRAGGSNAGGQFATVVLDISDREGVKNLFEKIPVSLRNVDILGML